MTITEGSLSHVTEPYGSFTAGVDEYVAVVRMKLCCSNHLCELLHVGRFDVYYVKRLQRETRTISINENTSIFAPCPIPGRMGTQDLVKKNTSLCAMVNQNYSLA